ncbi:LuxR C-terminal-related transcriptional regulator [Tsukamurella sp. NPDC003166]|uniref:helix-turn-helix transcriptional regulator n=1 Tax=Tsukamurella sp. NPDC003166 TaxID=3154444 RepID=UPI0033AB7764
MGVARLSGLVETIYAAGAGTTPWSAAVDEVLGVVGAVGGGLVRTSADGSRVITVSALAPTVVADYHAYYGALDGVVEAIHAGPIGEPVPGADLIRRHRGTEFHADWVVPNGFSDGVFVQVDAATTLVFVAPPGRRDYATRDRLAAIRLLAPHVRRSLALHARLAHETRAARGLSAAFDTVDRALVVVTANGETEHINAAAHRVLDERDGIRLDGAGRLTPVPRAAAELRTAIGHATGAHPRTGAVVLLPRPSGLPPLVAAVLPVRSVDDGAGRALVILADGAAEPDGPRPELLRRYFGLTDAEARVAVMIAEGLDVAAIADALRVARSTVRTHLRHLFQKTNTSRQTELAVVLHRLALGGTAPRPGRGLLHMREARRRSDVIR